MSTDARRARRTAEDARAEAIAAARGLLLAHGPASVTLKAVAAEVGTGHANLLHHFGTAAGLQSALMDTMIADTIAAIESAVEGLRTGTMTPRQLVDLVFDAFAAGGIGRLTAWLASTGEAARLQPISDRLVGLLRGIEAGALLPPADARRRIADMTLLLALGGLGDSLIGPIVHASTGDAPERMREMAVAILERHLGDRGDGHAGPASPPATR